jgi:hypothetical protein
VTIPVYNVNLTNRFDCVYTCVHCRFTGPCTVAAAGEGKSSPDVLFSDHEAMKRRAEEAAQKAASANARLLLLLHPCPNCRKRGAKAFFIKLAVATVGLAALLTLCVFLLLDKTPEWAAALVCAVLVVVILSYIIDRLWLMRTVTKYIAFGCGSLGTM